MRHNFGIVGVASSQTFGTTSIHIYIGLVFAKDSRVGDTRTFIVGILACLNKFFYFGIASQSEASSLRRELQRKKVYQDRLRHSQHLLILEDVVDSCHFTSSLNQNFPQIKEL